MLHLNAFASKSMDASVRANALWPDRAGGGLPATTWLEVVGQSAERGAKLVPSASTKLLIYFYLFIITITVCIHKSYSEMFMVVCLIYCSISGGYVDWYAR